MRGTSYNGDSMSSSITSNGSMSAISRHVARDGFKADDRYYLRRMKEILEAFPYKGPPYCTVQLCPHIYIGNQRNADDVEGLMRLGVTHVLNCAGTRQFDLRRSPYPHSTGIRSFMMIPAEDHDQYDIMQHFSDSIAFLDKCKAMGGKAFIHCNLGVNRSGAICAAYLMVYEQKPLLEVIDRLKLKRQFILTNKNFRRQLIRFARCKNLLDNVTDAAVEELNNRFNSLPSHRHGRDSDSYYSTRSLDRKDRMKVNQSDESIYRSDNGYNGYTPRSSSTDSNGYASQNYSNNQSQYSSYNGSSSHGYGLESVPERKPICDFTPAHSKYERQMRRDTQVHGSSSSLPASAPSTPKSVSFRRPTATDVTEDTQRVRSRSQSPSPKLGFLSRLGTRITRQRSLTSLSRTSSLDENDGKETGSKRSSLRNGSKEHSKVANVVDSKLSTTRPLKIYKRSSTDSEIYQKPSSQQLYRRAETIASADPGMERPRQQEELLPQEFLYHRNNLAHVRTSTHSKKESSNTSLNLFARLKPVKSKSRTNSPM